MIKKKSDVEPTVEENVTQRRERNSLEGLLFMTTQRKYEFYKIRTKKTRLIQRNDGGKRRLQFRVKNQKNAIVTDKFCFLQMPVLIAKRDQGPAPQRPRDTPRLKQTT